MDITVDSLTYEDSKPLFDFEYNNRAYFEKMVPSRGNTYYQYDTFLKQQIAILHEQEQGIAYFYLIKDRRGSILGRMNLVNIDRIHHTGYIGYRMGEEHTGQGVAQKALLLFMNTIKHKGISLVYAKTTTNNIASQRILEKNDFSKVEHNDEGFEMNGEAVKFVHYKRYL